MTPDPAYLAHVSTAIQGAFREAQGLVDEGEIGERLRQVVRHARELHEILAEELAMEARCMGDELGGALVDMGRRLRSLEQYLNAH